MLVNQLEDVLLLNLVLHEDRIVLIDENDPLSCMSLTTKRDLTLFFRSWKVSSSSQVAGSVLRNPSLASSAHPVSVG